MSTAVLLCTWWEKVLFQYACNKNIRKTRNDFKIQTRNGFLRPTHEAKVSMQELGTYLYVKLVEDPPLGRACDESGYSFLSQPGERTLSNEMLEDRQMLHW